MDCIFKKKLGITKFSLICSLGWTYVGTLYTSACFWALWISIFPVYLIFLKLILKSHCDKNLCYNLNAGRILHRHLSTRHIPKKVKKINKFKNTCMKTVDTQCKCGKIKFAYNSVVILIYIYRSDLSNGSEIIHIFSKFLWTKQTTDLKI